MRGLGDFLIRVGQWLGGRVRSESEADRILLRTSVEALVVSHQWLHAELAERKAEIAALKANSNSSDTLLG
jgi:hypothetical protein